MWALNNDPSPLTTEQRYTLSWDAATERFIAASTMTYDMQQKSNQFSDKFSLWLHELISSGKHGDLIRNIGGMYSCIHTIFFREYFYLAYTVNEYLNASVLTLSILRWKISRKAEGGNPKNQTQLHNALLSRLQRDLVTLSPPSPQYRDKFGSALPRPMLDIEVDPLLEVDADDYTPPAGP